VYHAIEPPASSHIAVGSFHQRSGPELVDCTFETIDRSRLGLLLFPVKWADNTQFAFEENGPFGLVFCAAYHHRSRPLRLSVTVLSPSPTFDWHHLDFLTDAARLTSLNFALFVAPNVTFCRGRWPFALSYLIIMCSNCGRLGDFFLSSTQSMAKRRDSGTANMNMCSKTP
jgi:hypothetical protein